MSANKPNVYTPKRKAKQKFVKNKKENTTQTTGKKNFIEDQKHVSMARKTILIHSEYISCAQKMINVFLLARIIEYFMLFFVVSLQTLHHFSTIFYSTSYSIQQPYITLTVVCCENTIII